MGNYFNSGGGAMNIATNNGIAIQNNEHNVTSPCSIDSLLKILDALRMEAEKLPGKVRAEVQNEVGEMEIQAKKEKPNKEKIADKLKNVQEILKVIPETAVAAFAFGDLIGKALIWCAKKY